MKRSKMSKEGYWAEIKVKKVLANMMRDQLDNDNVKKAGWLIAEERGRGGGRRGG